MATPQRQPRLSFDDLEVFLVVEYGHNDDVQFCSVGGDMRRLTDGHIATLLGTNRGCVWRYRHHDIPFWSGDNLAGRLGVHPCAIWPDFHTHHVELDAAIDKEFHATCT